MFTEKTFEKMLTILSKGSASQQEQIQFSKQLNKALKKGLIRFDQLDAKKPSHDLAQAVKQKMDDGVAKHLAIQKVAQHFGTSVFNVSKQYRMTFEKND